MLHLLTWYLLLALLGWLTFPLAWRLFPALADRGFSLARALGLLLWGYLFWLLASLGVIQNDGSGLFLTLILVAGLSAATMWRKGRRAQAADSDAPAPGLRAILEWLKSNRRMVIAVEALFFLAFAAWAFVRASNPNIETAGGEKTMELAFINAILRSPNFPPHDPWLSGYSISYYYFGYVMTAMLAKVTATPGAVAHNLMLALVFALSAAGAYGILYNLLAAWRSKHPLPTNNRPAAGLPLLGPLFLLLVSNFAGFLEVLHSRGVFWKMSPGGAATSSFWTWLGIKHLNQPPSLPLQWTPTRFIWWWQDSRVLQDYNLSGMWIEIIDEFPAFSFLLGDLHPHVLAMPFGLMVVAAALNLFLGGWKGALDLRLYRLPVRVESFLFGALLLGGMAFLNTWDILFGFALLAGAYGLSRALASGWTWERLADLFAFGAPLGTFAILFYLPFYLGFSSQAGGILPNLEFPTRGAHLWVMFGPLFLVLLAYLLHLWHEEKLPARWQIGFGLGIGLALLLWACSWALGLLASFKKPDFVANYLGSQGFVSTALYFGAATLKRLQSIASLLTLLSLLVPTIAFLSRAAKRQGQEADTPSSLLPSSPFLPSYFSLFLIFLGAALVLVPEFIYLRDLFGNRMNTIFKFYFQAWQLWSLAAAFGAAVMLQKLRGVWKWTYSAGLALTLAAALAFPAFGLPNKTNDFQFPAFQQALEAARAAGIPAPLRAAASVWTLDGARAFHDRYPDDDAAADWLSTAPAGVVAEAASNSTYSDYGRISVYSGQPAVIGWWWHEYQWRGAVTEQVSTIPDLNCPAESAPRTRRDDVRCLYETNDWELARTILKHYEVRYIVVGTLERATYNLDELKFQRNLVTVFQSGNTVIYEAP